MKALFQAVFFKEWALLKRYWLNSLISVVSIVLLFVLLFLGYRGLAGGSSDFHNGLSHLLTGYVLTILALFFFQDIAQNLSDEASEGVLEILHMSPYGYLRVGGARLFRLHDSSGRLVAGNPCIGWLSGSRRVSLCFLREKSKKRRTPGSLLEPDVLLF